MKQMTFVTIKIVSHKPSQTVAAAVAQWVRKFAPQAHGWLFESQPRQTYVVQTGCDSFTAKRSALGVSVTGTLR